MTEHQTEKLIEAIQNINVTLWFINFAICALVGVMLVK